MLKAVVYHPDGIAAPFGGGHRQRRIELGEHGSVLTVAVRFETRGSQR